jgi:plasmid stabilization system protein ParE
MPLSSKVQPLAEARLYQAASWYQDEEPASLLWLELFDEFEAVLVLVREHPESSPVYEGLVRRALLRRFPYAIYYVVEPNEIVVINFLAMQLERGPEPSR